jgi:hypothetical protein
MFYLGIITPQCFKILSIQRVELQIQAYIIFILI